METTDLNLFVRTSEETISDWDRSRIVDALMRETMIDRIRQYRSAKGWKSLIMKSGIKVVTAPLIRELVNAQLIEKGLESPRRMHTRLGMPIYDVGNLILHQNKENANVPHGPEATNLTLAEEDKEGYALLSVFSQDVADAHMNGDIHLHDLGFMDRPYCSGQSLEYIKKFGLNLPHSLSMAKPAKHPEVLLAHLVKFAAGPPEQLRRGHRLGCHQHLLCAVPRRDERQRGEAACPDAHIRVFAAGGGEGRPGDLHRHQPLLGDTEAFRGRPAIGPGGAFTGKDVRGVRERGPAVRLEALRGLQGGRRRGRPSSSRSPSSISRRNSSRRKGTRTSWTTSRTSPADKGNTYFVFDRGETAKISECCRLSFKLDEFDLLDAKEPWRMRYSRTAERLHQPSAPCLHGERGRHYALSTSSRSVHADGEGAQREADFHREAPFRRERTALCRF